MSATTARHFVVDTADAWGFGAVHDELGLLVSELVTNAVRHAESDGTIDLIELDSGVHVEVTDRSTAVPAMGRGCPDDTSGRGLGLVDQLATAWGVVRRYEGKAVWFELIARRLAPAIA